MKLDEIKTADKETVLKTIWINVASIWTYLVCSSEHQPDVLALIALISSTLSWVLEELMLKGKKIG